MSSAPRPDVSTARRLLREYFFSRIDIVAARQSWVDRKTKESISQPRPVKGEAHLDGLIAFHVAGPDPSKAPPLNYINRKTGGLVADKRGFDRVGSYAVAPDNTTVWLCFDFDGPGHPLPLADPQATMLACEEKCRVLGIPVHIEKSGSGQGWHLWVFFETPVPAADARLLAHHVAPTGHVLTTGEPADVRIGRGIECFPKQNTVSDKPFRAGNMVWLPFWYGAKDGGNQFHRIADGGGLVPYAPDGFERLTAARLQEILAQVPDDIRRFVLKTKGGLKDRPTEKSSPSAAPRDFAPTDSAVVHAALDHVSPDCSYDDWVRIGMALHHWDARAGLAIWDAWSARGEKYVEGEPSLKWDGFSSGGGVTLGTLFDMAKKAGWEPPEKHRAPLPTDEEIAAFMDVDPASLLDQVKSGKQREILGCLLEANRPLTPKEIAAEIGKDHNSTKVLLHRMAKDGKVRRDEAGGYFLGADVTQKAGDRVTSPVTSEENVTRKTHGAVTSAANVTRAALKNVTAPDGPRLPTIVVNNRQGPPVIDEAWAAVRASNYPPRIFQREGSLVRLVITDGVPAISAMNFVAVYGHLWRIANWVVDANDMQKATDPPQKIASDMLEYVDESLPRLESVVSTPVFDSSGNLVQTPGYHREARLWLHRPRGFEPADVPAQPSKSQINKARALLLDDLLTDFPFAAESDRAHAVAALLLPFVRRLIQGPTPLHLVEAPTPGTGKTLLAEAISRIVQAKPAEITTIENDEKENSKKITALLDLAPQVVLIDNIRIGLRSSQLAAVITSETWTDRVLGVTRMTSLPNNALWIATANNPTLSLEIARRCIRIRIDPRIDRPWKREGFKHDPLRNWVDRQRAELVHAVLTLVRAWIAAGMPEGAHSIGSFESWARVIGGILEVADIPGFLCNTEELYEVADAEGNEWREFIAAWWDRLGNRWVSTSELFDLAINNELLASITGDKSQRSQKTRLGKALSALRDRQFDTWRIKVRRERHSKQAEYGLEMVASDGSTTGSVLSLFPEQRPACPADVPQENPEQNQSAAGRAGHAGHNPSPDTRTRTYACTPEKGLGGNVPQDPHVPPALENIEKYPAGHASRPKTDVLQVPQKPSGDLADFDPQEEES
ncbi:PriCT-2 domain-containing protein [bacterium]|nr:PriCT-2 domain-containing protein [bacterium]